MHKDIITYKLAEGITEEHLLKIAEDIITNWMRKLDGFIKWEIHKGTDGEYTDIVYWESVEDAKKAEADMVNIPNAADWYGCYAEGSISTKSVQQVAAFDEE